MLDDTKNWGCGSCNQEYEIEHDDYPVEIITRHKKTPFVCPTCEDRILKEEKGSVRIKIRFIDIDGSDNLEARDNSRLHTIEMALIARMEE